MHGGSALDQVTNTIGYIIQLENIKYNTQELDVFAHQQQGAIFNEDSSLVVEGFVASLFKNGTININQSSALRRRNSSRRGA